MKTNIIHALNNQEFRTCAEIFQDTKIKNLIVLNKEYENYIIFNYKKHELNILEWVDSTYLDGRDLKVTIDKNKEINDKLAKHLGDKIFIKLNKFSYFGYITQVGINENYYFNLSVVSDRS